MTVSHYHLYFLWYIDKLHTSMFNITTFTTLTEFTMDINSLDILILFFISKDHHPNTNWNEMIGALGHDAALSRLYWARDNLCESSYERVYCINKYAMLRESNPQPLISWPLIILQPTHPSIKGGVTEYACLAYECRCQFL